MMINAEEDGTNDGEMDVRGVAKIGSTGVDL